MEKGKIYSGESITSLVSFPKDILNPIVFHNNLLTKTFSQHSLTTINNSSNVSLYDNNFDNNNISNTTTISFINPFISKFYYSTVKTLPTTTLESVSSSLI